MNVPMRQRDKVCARQGFLARLGWALFVWTFTRSTRGVCSYPERWGNRPARLWTAGDTTAASLASVAASFRLNADLLHDMTPGFELRANKVARFVSRAGTGGIEADLAQALHDFRLLEDRVHLAIHPL